MEKIWSFCGQTLVIPWPYNRKIRTIEKSNLWLSHTVKPYLCSAEGKLPHLCSAKGGLCSITPHSQFPYPTTDIPTCLHCATDRQASDNRQEILHHPDHFTG